MLPINRELISTGLPQSTLSLTASLATTVVANSTATVPKDPTEELSSNDASSRILFALLSGILRGMVSVRSLHAVLVAANLFWYQAIRQTVAVLSVFMCQEFSDRGMKTSHQAQLIAAPSVGNIATQAFGGVLLQWLPGGTTTAITIALVGLATGCILLPASISTGSSFLRKTFFLLALQGFLFGPMFPSHSVLLSKWLPPNERGSAMAYGEIAMSIASMGVPMVATSIAEYTSKASTVGWRNGFYVTGMACFAYLLVWIVLGRNDPESCHYISKQELNLIHSTKVAAEPPPSGPSPQRISLSPLQILLHPSILSLFWVHMIFNFVTLSINSWMPTYYNDVLKLRPSDAKLHIVLPQLAALLVKLCVSRCASLLQERRRCQFQGSLQPNKDERVVLLLSRRFMAYLGFTITAIPLWFLPVFGDTNVLGHSPWASTLLFSVALAGTGCHAESFRANYLDVTQQHVGLISGVGNCLSSLSAMVAPFVVGRIVKVTQGNWSPVWRTSSLLSLMAAVAFGKFSTTTPVEEK